MIQKSKFKNIFKQTLENSKFFTRYDDNPKAKLKVIAAYYIDYQRFYKHWFKSQGTSYVFVFKKNLKVTDIQYAELIALIKKFFFIKPEYQTETGDLKIGGLNFLSSSDFKDQFGGLLRSFNMEEKDNEWLYQVSMNPKEYSEDIVSSSQLDVQIGHFSNLYYEVFLNSILLDARHGTCNVFLPPHIDIDLRKICGYSGYIHSCGYNVYTRKVQKTDSINFKDEFKKYVLETLPKHTHPLFLGKKRKTPKRRYFLMCIATKISQHMTGKRNHTCTKVLMT